MSGFDPVDWNERRNAYFDPTFIPPDPHILPGRAELLRRPGTEYIGDVPTDGTPGTGGYVPIIRDPHHYAEPIELYSSVPDATAPQESVLILPQTNVRRNWMMIRNASATVDLYVSFGRTASAFSPLTIAAGRTVFFDTVVPQNDVYILASGPLGFIAMSWATISG